MSNVHVFLPTYGAVGLIVDIVVGVAFLGMTICVFIGRKKGSSGSSPVAYTASAFAALLIGSLIAFTVLMLQESEKASDAVASAVEDQLGVEFIGDASDQIAGYGSEAQTIILDANGKGLGCLLIQVENNDDEVNLLVTCDDGPLPAVEKMAKAPSKIDAFDKADATD